MLKIQIAIQLLICLLFSTQALASESSILSLQPYAVTEKDYARPDLKAKLTNINPNINSWFFLTLEMVVKNRSYTFHLENIDKKNPVKLAAGGLTIGDQHCPLWENPDLDTLLTAKKKSKPFVSLCNNKIFLRKKVQGYTTTKEWVVEFVRGNLWGGEALISGVKNTVYKDKYLQLASLNGAPQPVAEYAPPTNSPLPANTRPEISAKMLLPEHLGISLRKSRRRNDKRMALGKWYEVQGEPNMFISIIYPDAISDDIMNENQKLVRNLDSVEKKALTYLAAFNLEAYEMHFSTGTDHPKTGWSDRSKMAMRNVNAKGPDGINSSDPIVQTGLVPPTKSEDIVATFTGGFKRSHGAFKFGKLANINHGSHYGFVENGVIFSSLQPHLSTLYILTTGEVGLKTWQSEDQNSLGPKILHARQNGVPIVEAGIPGKLVKFWGKGNWSGNEHAQQRTLRAGMCLTKKSKKYKKGHLIYGYFSSVTSSAMARVFQAYDCEYAMHLDMNALEHTYLARYVRSETKARYPEQLIKGMAVLDRRFGKQGKVPRFVGYPDNRDFFYLLRLRK